MLRHQGRPVWGQGPVCVRLLQAGQKGRAVSDEVRRQPWGPRIFARENSEISTRCLDLEERKENSLSLHFRFFNSAAVNLLRKGLQAVCTLLSRESVILASLVCQT